MPRAQQVSFFTPESSRMFQLNNLSDDSDENVDEFPRHKKTSIDNVVKVNVYRPSIKQSPVPIQNHSI
jgi:hypothetical protein